MKFNVTLLGLLKISILDQKLFDFFYQTFGRGHIAPLLV